MRVEFELSIKCISEANKSQHWGTKAKRAKKQKNAAWLFASVEAKPFHNPKSRIVVTLTKINPPNCRNLDTDNLANSMKHCQDGIAKALGVDDGDSIVKWKYSQKRGPSHAVHVSISGKGMP